MHFTKPIMTLGFLALTACGGNSNDGAGGDVLEEMSEAPVEEMSLEDEATETEDGATETEDEATETEETMTGSDGSEEAMDTNSEDSRLATLLGSFYDFGAEADFLELTENVPVSDSASYSGIAAVGEDVVATVSSEGFVDEYDSTFAALGELSVSVNFNDTASTATATMTDFIEITQDELLETDLDDLSREETIDYILENSESQDIEGSFSMDLTQTAAGSAGFDVTISGSLTKADGDTFSFDPDDVEFSGAALGGENAEFLELFVSTEATNVGEVESYLVGIAEKD